MLLVREFRLFIIHENDVPKTFLVEDAGGIMYSFLSKFETKSSRKDAHWPICRLKMLILV
jgi:hypothetical protein